jgi:hypothetical protein
MRPIVAKAAVVAAAACGLAASFLVPLGLGEPAAPEEALRMPVATRETTISVFPAPGRPESSPAPLERAQPPAPRPLRPRLPLPVAQAHTRRPPPDTLPVTRAPAPPIRPQTDERLLAELGPARPDDRSPRHLVAD